MFRRHFALSAFAQGSTMSWRSEATQRGVLTIRFVPKLFDCELWIFLIAALVSLTLRTHFLSWLQKATLPRPLYLRIAFMARVLRARNCSCGLEPRLNRSADTAEPLCTSSLPTKFVIVCQGYSHDSQVESVWVISRSIRVALKK